MRLVIEGAAFYWAAARVDLPRRLRAALWLTGGTSFASAVNYLLLVSEAAGGPRLLSSAADAVFTLASYVGAMVALLIYPRAAARPGERPALLIDLVITAGGLGLVSWVLVTAPTAAGAGGDAAYWLVIVFGLAQLGMLVGINVVVVRGLPLPSRRAFWWFVAGQATYLPVVVLAQFEEAGLIDGRWGTIVYFLGVLPTLVAAVLMRADPLLASGDRLRQPWLAHFNPLPLLVPIAVGGSLLAALLRGPQTAALIMAVALTAVSLLLALRLLLSARQAAERTRAEAEAERARQRDKMDAVGRLAGGVAHEFNNLMARVIGHAELGEEALPEGTPAREEFAEIRTAATRAAALTSQLLVFSGRQRPQRQPLDIGAWLQATGYPAAVRALPSAIAPALRVDADGLRVAGDASQLMVVLGELTTNAVEAMPSGGRLEVTLTRADLDEPLTSPLLRAPAGSYAVLGVGDTGRGIPDADRPVICDPFFSTKPPHLAAGLGLATVHGIVAAHGGGLAVESAAGAGTRVSVYLPLAT
jgi:signal transduction histidine kinase